MLLTGWRHPTIQDIFVSFLFHFSSVLPFRWDSNPAAFGRICRLFRWGISWAYGVKKNWCTTHFLFSFPSKSGKKRNKRGQASIRDNIYKIDKLLWALTWGSSSSYFSSFRPPERDGQNKKRSCFGVVWWREEIWRWQPCVDITGW